MLAGQFKGLPGTSDVTSTAILLLFKSELNLRIVISNTSAAERWPKQKTLGGHWERKSGWTRGKNVSLHHKIYRTQQMRALRSRCEH